ncbi:MAG: hypothetical protein IJV38_11225 [Prevotella sp.]|nr:hypothetical protein [Prevotella sp.]
MMNNLYSQARPNQGFGAQRREVINPEALKEGVPEIGGVMNEADVLEVGMKRALSGEMSQEDLGILFRLNSNEVKASFLKKKLNLKVGSPIPDESVNVELKAGLKAIPNTYWATMNHGGIKLIITEAAAVYNTSGNGSVYVGIGDDNKRPTGLENQIACMFPGMNLDRVASTVLYNIARTWTQSLSFINSLAFSWFLLNSHLVLHIDIQKIEKSDVVLCNPKDWMLPFRIGATLRTAKGYDLIKIYNQIH